MAIRHVPHQGGLLLGEPSTAGRGCAKMIAASNKKKLVDRTVIICGEERVVRQRWKRRGTSGFLLTSVLLSKRDKAPQGGKLEEVAADEAALVELGREHAEAIRKRAEIRQPARGAAAAASSARRKRTTRLADSDLCGPLHAQFNGGTRSSARPRIARPESVSPSGLSKDLGACTNGRLDCCITKKIAFKLVRFFYNSNFGTFSSLLL